MKKIQIKDIVALLSILIFGALRWHGVDSGFDAPLAIILGYYFVKRSNGEDNGH